ncbi:MAG: hypothetical protein UR61_C0063G0009 [candidate division WS6 bacterium GW2011_GWE1_34_7]|uniref:Uncharacterized protein n=1 Tax=candidate division WS6 bacterium GW2011_GWE1_34_7 TaxID=1619093 RepID=A0A0G0BJK0_9BACT|nr:MAG: hypothetical protein UR61_C0063G0009 [candidate division WS6 bacterium GW2011_GWE1_34_7]KKQ76245.1 MAG: hypothetical protein US97_C0015G0002 [Microgenomates group bacterium GW2011_GWF1_38_5]
MLKTLDLEERLNGEVLNLNKLPLSLRLFERDSAQI